MEKLLTQELIDLLPGLAYWKNKDGNFYSSVEHLNYLNSLNLPDISIPENVITLVKNITVPVEPVPDPSLDLTLPSTYDEAIISSRYIPQFGEEAFYNPEINRWVAKQLTFEGAGVSSNNITGWVRRFNGMTISNSTAPMTEFGMLIHSLEITEYENDVNRKVSIRHYDVNGGDQKIVSVITLNKFDHQFGSGNNLKLFIPGGRRITFYLEEADNKKRHDSPQLRISYRRVLSND